MKSKITLGILAHVDAGKTTLSESLLFQTGEIKEMGRVDKKNAFLDTFDLEKARGITIYAKQAIFELESFNVTLLDTPGHVDFSAEMERTLSVLDYAILVISGSDGAQGHTKTLWSLLKYYEVPTFVFVNKMDQPGTDALKIMKHLKTTLDESCVDMASNDVLESLALCNETMLETYLSSNTISEHQIRNAIKRRSVFPCYFGSALKFQGIDGLLAALDRYMVPNEYVSSFGAKVFKISRDEQGNRLTHMKVTGGALAVRDLIVTESWEEKVTQIRVYSGGKFEAPAVVPAGTICAVTGLSQSHVGQGLGFETDLVSPILEPVLSYQMILPEGIDPKQIMPSLLQIKEEEPELKFFWNARLEEIEVRLMGEVQIEVLQSRIKERFGFSVTFDEGHILYKETLLNTVEGVGHFEPLRHYAEVHLLMAPGKPQSGILSSRSCDEGLLAKNWQKLVLTHIHERAHKGVLVGGELTDVSITLVGGKAYKTHTDGGDFREATYRAIRQGLKEGQCQLLEPYYHFELTVPENVLGRAITEIENKHGTWTIVSQNAETAILEGKAPVATLKNYQKEVAAYTKGRGHLTLNTCGYFPCHNEAEIIESTRYDSEADAEHPTGSVFCKNGVGYFVPWDHVKNLMHVPPYLKASKESHLDQIAIRPQKQELGLDEIDAIINSISYANQGKKEQWKKEKSKAEAFYSGKPDVKRHLKEYMLIDGYNLIFAWPELSAMANENLEAARGMLQDILCNFQPIRGCELMVVYDAYKVKGRKASHESYHNIQLVFTAEAQTADQYIEKFSHQHRSTYRVTVVTSDAMQQMIIRGAGSDLISAREFMALVEAYEDQVRLATESSAERTKFEEIVTKKLM